MISIARPLLGSKVILLAGATPMFLALKEKVCSIILKRHHDVLEDGPGIDADLIVTNRPGKDFIDALNE